MLESKFKSDFKNDIRVRIPHVKMFEPKTHTRGAPDLIILGPGCWAVVEFKRFEDADRQPGQEDTIDILGEMGFAYFAFPENAEEVLNGLERLFPTY